MARQLGRPEGVRGSLVARALNRGNLAVVTAAVELAGVASGGTAADIGFGGGVGLRLLLDRVGPGGRVHGVDLAQTMVDAARRRHRTECRQGTLSVQRGTIVDLPLQDGTMDAAITVNTVYFVDDLARALSEVARVLRPGGRLVIGIGDPAAIAALPVTDHGFRIRPVDELLRMLEHAGFEVLRHDRVDDAADAKHLLVGQRPVSSSTGV